MPQPGSQEAKVSHTPGPWFIGEGISWYFIADKNGRSDGRGSTLGDGIASTYGGHVPQAKANARLIAAAPELLASCKQLLSALREYTDGNETPAQSSILNAAETAIRQATQEE